MPIYEYSCPKCGEQFEELVFGDTTPPCPQCGGKDSEKLMSRAARCACGDSADESASGGCGGCSGGNCACCGH